MTGRGPVAVVGVACVFPGAPDAARFWDNIVEGRDSITEAPADRLDPRHVAALGPPGGGQRSAGVPTVRGGFVEGEALDFEPARFGVMPVAVEGTEPDQLIALKTAATALEDAGGLEGVAPERVGVILGRGGYLGAGLARVDQRVRTSSQLIDALARLLPELDEGRLTMVREAFDAQLGELDPESSIGVVPNLAASRIANRFDFGGPAYTIDGACASSLLAVDAAVSELASGRCDAALAGGVHHCQDVTLWSVFSQLGALSRSGVIAPFSRQADGVLLSEGTGVVVLERLADAERLGHRVYAVIRGVGAASDGRHTSLVSPRVDGQVLALRRAYEDAGLDPSAVRLVEGHGTATSAGDRAELETLRRVYNGHAADAPSRVLGSVKSNIGHALPAAGAAGLIKTLLAVHHGVLPPTLHAEEPSPALGQTSFRLLDCAEEWTGRGLRLAGVNAFGFGGVNAHVVLEQHPSSLPAARRRLPKEEPRPDAVLLQGRDAADLAGQLAGVSCDGAARPLPAQGGVGPARMAIIEPNPRRLELAARILAKGLPWRGRNDIWFEPAGLVSSGGRVAFVFPGIEPTASARIDDVARRFGLDLPAGPAGARGLERHGREMFETGRLLHRALGILGAVPDDIAGHSLGEWTAVFAGELIPPACHEEFLEGLEPGSLELPGVVFLALGCGARTAEKVVAGLEGVFVSHDNCPHQSLVCGPEAVMVEARRRFAEHKVVARELPYRSGFHTPYFEPYLDVVRRHWARMPLQPARVPVWSATICERYPTDPDDVRRLAVEHHVRPVRFRELIERMHDDGVRVFVQLGIGSLVAFADDTLRDREHLAIAAASSERSGIDQLARAATALWVEGVEVDVGRLVAARGSSSTCPGEGRTATADASRGPTIRLSLGSPFVELPESAALDVRPTRALEAPSWPDGASPSLRVELDALFAEAMEAAQAMSSALVANEAVRARAPGASAAAQVGAATRPVPEAVPPAAAPVPEAPPPATAPVPEAPPAAAPVPEAVPPAAARRSEPLLVGASELPWLADHCFYRQPDGADLEDRFPVLPMTTTVELLAEAAARLVPGRRVAAVERVRALRWLVGAPPTRADVSVRLGADDRVEASIEGFARATVRLVPAAGGPPAPGAPPAPLAPLTNPRPAPFSDARIYADHWMFHGPAFQGITSVSAVGDDGITGTVLSLRTPGAWLDSAGQLVGLWIIATFDEDLLAFPQSIERIEWFGPQPPLGVACEATVRITDVAPRSVRADLELRAGGSVLVRATGWVVRRFDSTKRLWEMLRWPERHLAAEPFGPRSVSVEERWGDSASRELMARRFLDRSEREEYARLNPTAQRLWLLSRMAAKDAVRRALWDAGHGPLFPIEVPLAHDGPDGFTVAGGPAAGRRVAVAASPWVAVASLDTAAVEVECVDGDESAARHRLLARLALKSRAGATREECGILCSAADGKEYLVARSLPS